VDDVIDLGQRKTYQQDQKHRGPLVGSPHPSWCTPSKHEHKVENRESSTMIKIGSHKGKAHFPTIHQVSRLSASCRDKDGRVCGKRPARRAICGVSYSSFMQTVLWNRGNFHHCKFPGQLMWITSLSKYEQFMLRISASEENNSFAVGNTTRRHIILSYLMRVDLEAIRVQRLRRKCFIVQLKTDASSAERPLDLTFEKRLFFGV
jgi:hypothetical protein